MTGAISTTPTRNTAIDLMRALCILYIVGFWHLLNYADSLTIDYENGVTYRMTVAALGLFTLISGYLIGRKDIAPDWRGISTFYKTRLLRIYPPYLAAIAAFAAFKIATVPALLKSTVLLSMLFAPAPFTLWFIVMLMSFYVIAPPLIQARSNLGYFSLFCLLIINALLALSLKFDTVDMRILLYFPAFATGIYLAGQPDRLARVIDNIPALGALVGAALLLIFAAMMQYQDRFKPMKIVYTISFASFFMYLFHRPVYKLVTYFYTPETMLGDVLFLMGVCLPLVIALSWTGQTIYDHLTHRLFSTKRAAVT